ncbi:hypothetical protein VI03_12500 [Burkholderia vietnamiensis]|nr:hypothetical protein [Burkholderia vietnamiensis]KKI38582.1 hypothetical protein VI03_12500 [Burkholderia vietnamiensis]MBE0629607.1 hypothetical protein [Burkholderia vietnamiensis]MBR8228981.1 hypothetical protein [Burkholderia vietnamiensis]MDN8033236.1 hypothetical protein [Burkholderia vietnamiensis]CAG9189994.1 conserved hypothetical protein [Burkholderia vietnamiensis]
MIHRTADPSSRPRVCAALPRRCVRRIPLAVTVSPDYYMKTTNDGTLSVAVKPLRMARVGRRDFAHARSARSTRSDDFAPLIRRVVALGASGTIERHAQRKPATPLPAIDAAGRARVRGLFRIES